MTDTIEKNSQSVAEILGEQEENQEIENQEPVQEDNIEEKEEATDAENATVEESEDPEEELKFLKLTSGWTKEEKELVKKIKDPELREEAIEATKKRRVDFYKGKFRFKNKYEFENKNGTWENYGTASTWALPFWKKTVIKTTNQNGFINYTEIESEIEKIKSTMHNVVV